MLEASCLTSVYNGTKQAHHSDNLIERPTADKELLGCVRWRYRQSQVDDRHRAYSLKP
jgi:hypothetical protein